MVMVYGDPSFLTHIDRSYNHCIFSQMGTLIAYWSNVARDKSSYTS